MNLLGKLLFLVAWVVLAAWAYRGMEFVTGDLEGDPRPAECRPDQAACP